MIARPDMAGLRDQLAANSFLTRARGPESGPVVTIILPLYNAVNDAAACLASVARHTSCPFRLLLINDGSSDPRVSAMLADLYGVADGLVVVDRPDNYGFVVTINEGLALTPEGDVVILNSDTVVTRGWLEKLIAVSRSRPNVATVTPLTNNGTICSIPTPLVDNAIPDGYDVDSFAALIESTSRTIFPEAPTGVGFCMLMTRPALDAVGPFDVQSFGLGYGEESDFSQRAIAAGFVNLIADHTFVYHKGGASFGDRTRDLLARNLEVVATKHPRYEADVAAFCRAHPLREFHADLQQALAARIPAASAVRTRILHVLHHGGGTERHARDLAAIEDPDVMSYVLISTGRELQLDEYHSGTRRRSLLFPLKTVVGSGGPRYDSGYRQAFTTICWSLGVNMIHVHHLMANALDIADVAGEQNVPFVMTLHDYYMFCPSYTLLDPAGEFCGACLGQHPGKLVDACMNAAGQPASYLTEYQERTRGFLRRAARIFAPNSRVREIVAARFPELAENITIIEHGHRRASLPPADSSYDGRGSLNVAVIGGLERHKGAQVLRALLRANRSDAIVFHLYGTTHDSNLRARPGEMRTLDGSRFVYHGPYEAEQIVHMLRAAEIHVGLQLAIWPETFSYTLSELVEAGIPVIVGNLGAPGERVRRCQLGWTVPEIREPNATIEIFEAIRQRPALLGEVARAMRREEALPPLDATWRTYSTIYRELSSTVPASQGQGTRGAEKLAPDYVDFLAKTLADRAGLGPAGARLTLAQMETDLAAARERLKSPRHRIAEAVGNVIQKIPVLWPMIARLTDAVLERENARKKN